MRQKDFVTLVLAWTLSAVASCDRAQLIQARDDFWKAASSGGQPALAPSAIIALNNEVVPLRSTPFTTLGKGDWTRLKVQAVDTEICEIATFRVAKSQVLSTRLKLDESRKIKEVEFLQAVQGDQFFRPSGFPDTTPAIFGEKQTPFPPPVIPSQWTPSGGMFNFSGAVNRATCKATRGNARLWSRNELLYAASSYADGLKGAPFDSCVFAGSSCPRNENGVTTTQNCAKGTGIFGFNVRGRRWTVDIENGIVLGAFYFDYTGLSRSMGKNLFLHEYFKVDKGALRYIFAPMKNIPPAKAAASTFSQSTAPSRS